jgi:hypothetical protein
MVIEEIWAEPKAFTSLKEAWLVGEPWSIGHQGTTFQCCGTIPQRRSALNDLQLVQKDES